MPDIVLKNVSYTYSPGTPFARKALEEVSVTLRDGEFIGLIGHTGSGKSTLVQLLNGLLLPTEGEVQVGDILLEKGKNLLEVRKTVGLVFQYPEYQLFEETVAKDIAFGPKNLGLSQEEVNRRVKEAMASVGLSEELAERSPFELSGGQKRRVAIAGVLAMNPSILVLDEPTAGLDPHGRNEILGQIKALHAERKMTIVLVSHSMEDVGRIAERMLVMDHGHLVMDGTPREIFQFPDALRKIGLGVPEVRRVMEKLKARFPFIHEDCITVEEAKAEILRAFKEVGHA